MRTLAGVWTTAGTVGGAGTDGVVIVGRAGRITAEADIGEGQVAWEGLVELQQKLALT